MKLILKQITADYPYDLLLLADETIEGINKYLFKSEVYVAELPETEQPVGVFCLCKIDADTAEIMNIAVSEAYQSKGIGSYLIDKAIAIAREKGYRQLIVGTADCGIRQIRFYEKNGFVKYDIRKNYFTDIYDTPIYENSVQLKDMVMLKRKINKEYKLRPWLLSDLPNLAKHANNQNIAKWLTNGFPHPYTETDAKTFIEAVMKDSPTKVFAIEIDEEAVGSIGIFPQTDIHERSAEMGYWLSEKYWGRGIMPNAIAKIVEYGFGTFDIVRIYARPFSTNKGSQRVLEKAGFQLEARLKKALYKNDEYMDELIYVKLKSGE